MFLQNTTRQLITELYNEEINEELFEQVDKQFGNLVDGLDIYLSVIAACFLFGFIYSAIYKWVNILEWIFVFITAASFFVSGIWLVMKGCFNNIK